MAAQYFVNAEEIEKARKALKLEAEEEILKTYHEKQCEEDKVIINK